jgi:rSAM/selenodomain-associated transferase 2
MIEKISIIIPVLNEAANIGAAIASIQAPNTEIIVVDGGSTDNTRKIAEELGAITIASPPGRSLQMNAGAKIATGDILLFLHGDSRLPEGFDRLVRETLEAGAIAGAFTLRIDAPQPQFRWIEWGVKLRSRWFQMPYGDQGIFLHQKVFWEIGGFPELPIMEDFEFMRRLQKLGSLAQPRSRRIVILEKPIATSARRWLQRGIWQTTLINQLMIVGYLLGIDPHRLLKLYRRRRSSG